MTALNVIVSANAGPASASVQANAAKLSRNDTYAWFFPPTKKGRSIPSHVLSGRATFRDGSLALERHVDAGGRQIAAGIALPVMADLPSDDEFR
jgi:hypothetical protein